MQKPSAKDSKATHEKIKEELNHKLSKMTVRYKKTSYYRKEKPTIDFQFNAKCYLEEIKNPKRSTETKIYYLKKLKQLENEWLESHDKRGTIIPLADCI